MTARRGSPSGRLRRPTGLPRRQRSYTTPRDTIMIRISCSPLQIVSRVAYRAFQKTSLLAQDPGHGLPEIIRKAVVDSPVQSSMTTGASAPFG